jgi:glutathione S-transferase
MIDLYELAGADPNLRFSPYCWRIRMALAHKSLNARFIGWHYGDKRLPGGITTVPVLVDDSEVIGDSTAIALHLERKYADGPSLFGDENCAAHIRFIIAWTDTVLQPALFPMLGAEVIKHVKPAQQGYYRETREQRLGTTLERAAETRAQQAPAAVKAMAPLRSVLEDEDFVGGGEPSYADYAVFGAFQWYRILGAPELLDNDDPVFAWRERMLELFDGLAMEAKTAVLF